MNLKTWTSRVGVRGTSEVQVTNRVTVCRGQRRTNRKLQLCRWSLQVRLCTKCSSGCWRSERWRFARLWKSWGGRGTCWELSANTKSSPLCPCWDIQTVVGGASNGQQSILTCSQPTLNPTPLFSSPRENHPDQGADRRQRPSAQKPALCHSGCHRSCRPAAQSHDSPLRGHNRLPVSAATPAHRLLFSHPGGYQALSECSRRGFGQIFSFMVLFLTQRSTLC